MDGNMSARNMMPVGSYGMLDLQGSMHMHPPQQQIQAPVNHPHHKHPNNPQHQGSVSHPPMHDIFPMLAGHTHECNHHHEHQQPATLPMMDYNKGDRTKTSTSDEDEPSFNTEDGADGQNDGGKGKKASSPWQRMKWTDGMVRLLITAVSYIGEDAALDCNGKRKNVLLQKKGKWKSVSKVMAERGCYVSPQQCEDKFNDLNKRYKRLNDILGRGTSCQVVENPALLDMMDISEKAKEDIRKILSSKHLFYEEMCSYHNGNRLHLPADPALQRSLQLALSSGDDHDTRRVVHEDLTEEDHATDSDDEDETSEKNTVSHGDIGSVKRMKPASGHDEMGFGTSLVSQDNNRFHPQGIQVGMNQNSPDGTASTRAQKQWLSSRSLQLQEQRLHIQAEMLELEEQRFKWQRFSRKKDRELEKMKMENERMKLETERVSLELKCKELELEQR